MDKRAERLAPVIDMARQAERDAARQMGAMQQQLSGAEQKFAELERYREDYQQQWQQQGRSGVSGQWLINYQRFLSQLEAALSQQAQVIEWHRGNLEKARLQWQQRNARLQGLSRLVERYALELRQTQERREQKQADEWVQQRFARREEES